MELKVFLESVGDFSELHSLSVDLVIRYRDIRINNLKKRQLTASRARSPKKLIFVVSCCVCFRFRIDCLFVTVLLFCLGNNWLTLTVISSNSHSPL